ncbi:hypothetical protein D770_13285 [Flammeovirgaceae bacterium 311]|nr:hypothetical protein D770_13285 [Flammeovirgaceae bacterium 311]
MTTIFCSHKLQTLIGKISPRPAEEVPSSPLGNWNAHLFTVERRKCLAFVNSKTYYSVFLADILKKDLRNFQDLFYANLIRQLLHDEVIDLARVPLVTETLGPLQLARTNNDRKAIGTMNDFISQFKFNCDWHYGGFQHINLREINSRINDTPVGAGGNEQRNYGWPIEDMKTLIKTVLQLQDSPTQNL